MLLMAYPGQGSRSMHKGHALFQLKNCWQVLLLGLDPRNSLTYIATGKERFSFIRTCKKIWCWESSAAAKRHLLTPHLRKSLVFTQSCAMQTAVWFQCNSSQCSCQRGLVATMRLNQYLQQLHGTLPSGFLSSAFKFGRNNSPSFPCYFQQQTWTNSPGMWAGDPAPANLTQGLHGDTLRKIVKVFWAAETQALFVSCTLNSNNAAPMQLIYCL